MALISGILLAGGKSSRMGKEKGLMVFNGKPLAQYSLDQLQKQCSEIIISSNNHLYQQFGFPVKPDEIKDAGPAGALATVLKYTSHDWNMVLACDLPFAGELLFKPLINAISNRYKAIIPYHNGMSEPLAALYHRSMQPIFAKALEEQEFAMHRILKEVPALYFNVETLLEENPLLFTNLNNQVEFEQFNISK